MTIGNDQPGGTFAFAWGDSELTDRLKALEELAGSQAELIRLSGIEGAAYKMALKRGSSMPTDRAGAIARGTGVSLDYLVWGRPITARDGECEEKRFDLAARDFVIPSSAERREERRLQIATARIDLEDHLAALSGLGAQEPDRTFAAAPPKGPDGFVLLRPLMPEVIRSGQGYYTDDAPAPVAIAAAWLDRFGHGSADVRFVAIQSVEGGSEFAPGTIVLIDSAALEPVDGKLFAMNIGGEPQLRRMVRRLSGALQLVHVSPAWPPEDILDASDAPIMGAVFAALAPVDLFHPRGGADTRES